MHKNTTGRPIRVSDHAVSRFRTRHAEKIPAEGASDEDIKTFLSALAERAIQSGTIGLAGEEREAKADGVRMVIGWSGKCLIVVTVLDKTRHRARRARRGHHAPNKPIIAPDEAEW